jgi:AraC family transcriptional regulator, exoenzyme S synthesis regulatory protein ExsA
MKMMLNALETIRSDPKAKIFEVGGLVFAQFSCPATEQSIGIWTQTDHLVHVLSGKSTWKTPSGICSAQAGETMFFKKGAYIMPPHFEEQLCIELFFIPDAFVRETVFELAAELPALSKTVDWRELTIPVRNDLGLTAFFEAMTIYFADNEKPLEALLKLKLKELLANILLGRSNPDLSAYLRSIAASGGPAIPAIMETNFHHNLSIDEFARMCNRSVSSFKREFQKHYATSPGKWLLKRRLQHSATLLQSTSMSVTEIAFNSGFEDLSHFSRVFKEKYGRSPSLYRKLTDNIFENQPFTIPNQVHISEA